MKDDEAVIVMAFDAFRVCIGMQPKTFSREQIIRWIRHIGKAEYRKRGGAK